MDLWVLVIGLLGTVVALAITGRRVRYLFRLITSGQPAPDRVAGVTKRLGRAVSHPGDRGVRPEEAAQVVDPRRRALLRVLGVPDPRHGLPRGVRHPALAQPRAGRSRSSAHWDLLGFAQDFIAIMALVGIVTFAAIRLRETPEKLGRKSRFTGSHLGGAWLVLFMIFNVIWTMFLFRGAVGGRRQPARTATAPSSRTRSATCSTAWPRHPRDPRGRRPAAPHRRHAGVPGRRGALQAPAHLPGAAQRAVLAPPAGARRGQAADERRQAAHPRRHRRPRRGRQARRRLDRGLQLEGHPRLRDLHRVRSLPVAVPGLEHREAAVAEDADHDAARPRDGEGAGTSWPARGRARGSLPASAAQGGRAPARRRDRGLRAGSRPAAASSTPTCCGPA